MGADPSLTCGPVAWEKDDEQDVGSEGGGRDAAGGGRRGRRGSEGRARADRGEHASDRQEIGRAHVCTPVTNAHLVCRLLHEQKTIHRMCTLQKLHHYYSYCMHYLSSMT